MDRVGTRVLGWAWLSSALLALPSAVLAATPGVVGDILKPTPTPPLPQQASPVVVPESPLIKPAPAGGKRFVVEGFSFSGDTQFPSEQLAALVADYLGRPVTVGELYQAAERLTRHYRKAGFPLASVGIPPQTLAAGRVELRVIEGKIGAIGFDGQRSYGDSLLRFFLRQTRVGEVYRAGALERDLQILNTLPGLSTKAILKPGTEFGSSDVEVKVSEDPYQVVLAADNHGRQDVGEYRYSAFATINNPLGAADQLELSGLHSNTNRLNFGQVAYSLPLNAKGIRIKGHYNLARFSVAGPSGISGKNQNGGLELQLPLIQRYHQQLSATVGIQHTDADASLDSPLGELPLSSTRITLAELVLANNRYWSGGAVTQTRINLRSNFRSASSTERDEGQPLKAELDVQHLHPTPMRSSVLLRVHAVHSPEPLPETEQMSLGGPGSLRGFAPSEARGDRGFHASATLQKPMQVGPIALVPKVFVDTGRVTQLAFGPGGTDSSNSLTSAGLGFEASYKRLNFRLDWSRPLDSRPVSDGRDDGRAYAALSFHF